MYVTADGSDQERPKSFDLRTNILPGSFLQHAKQCDNLFVKQDLSEHELKYMHSESTANVKYM